MATLKSIVKEVILEEKQKNLKVFYDIDIEIKPKKKPETPQPDTKTIVPNTPVSPEVESSAPPTPAPAVAESVKKSKGILLNEEEETSSTSYTNKIKGESIVPEEDAMNIQTINDLIEYLSGREHEDTAKKTSIEKIVDKKAKTVKAGKIISQEVQDIILILTGVSGEASAIGDLIDNEDKIIIEIKYGNGPTDNVGLKINKNSGTDVASTTIVKDGELLAGKFDPELINKQILFFRNSLT